LEGEPPIFLAGTPLPNTYLLDVLPASLIVALGLPAVTAASNIAAVTLMMALMCPRKKSVCYA
jgi:hypothetical protein